MDPPSTTSERTLDDIINEVKRFRILVIGRSGVGKSSLINCVFGINDAHVEDQKVGEADIEQEYVSQQNQLFVLHDSKGFEPGDLKNFKTVSKFVNDRSKKELLEDRIHGLWLCTATPTAGGRVFETGDEKLLKFAHENELPLVLVFTQYDRLLRTKEFQLREENNKREEKDRIVTTDLHDQSRAKAQEAFETCLKSLKDTMAPLPIPTYAKVSVREGYQDASSMSSLVEITTKVAKDRVKGDAWVLWAMAQRKNLPSKIEASITKGISYHLQALTGRVIGAREWTLRTCLEKVHRDIITCWGFKGEVLNSRKFQEWMFRLVDDIHTERGAPNPPPNFNLVNSVVGLATSISTSIVPGVSAVGLGVLSLQWGHRTLKENFAEARQLLIAYTVDLIKVLIELFDRTLKSECTTNWRDLEAAFEAYEWSPSRKSIHASIRSKQRGVTDSDDMIRREIRQLLEVDEF